MISRFTNRDLYPIQEAYMHMICENAEGKNINRAEKYVKQSHPEIIGLRLQNGQTMTPRKFTEEIRNLMPNVRGANCKFLLGVARLYFEDLTKDRNSFQRNASKLDKILKVVTSDAHVNEYDHNLNGLSLQQLSDKFGSAVQQNLQNDMKAMASSTYNRNTEYDIVKIPDFEAASKYARYTSWCVTHYDSMYDNYTKGGMGVFYFCLRKGFENVPPEPGEGCPMDDYGKSMIAISVNDDGSLNTCTCRWNHDHGGNDSMMTTKEISDFFGVNFYQVFKPKDANELMEKYREDAVMNDFADRMGWIYVYAGDGNYDYVAMKEATAENPSPSIVKYREVYADNSNIASSVVCIASDRFYWYNKMSGRMIEPPERADIVMKCEGWPQLTSLLGSPRRVKAIECIGCDNLESIDGAPDQLETLILQDCPKLTDKAIAPLADKPLIVKSLLNLSDDTSKFNMDPDGTVTALVSFSDIADVYEDGRGDVSWDFIDKFINGDSVDLFYSSDYVPKMNDMDDCDFDKILSESGFDVTWSDIADLYDDYDYDEEKISDEQADEIRNLIDDDFYEGMGIRTIYSDCEQYGAESEAYKSIIDGLFSELYLDEDYGIRDGMVKIVLPKNIVVDCVVRSVKEYDANIFILLRSNGEEEDDVEKISVSEPYYGFSGFDDEAWKTAVDGFAKEVVNILSKPKPIKDSEGQMTFNLDDE